MGLLDIISAKIHPTDQISTENNQESKSILLFFDFCINIINHMS